jgi:hypothetical protein
VFLMTMIFRPLRGLARSNIAAIAPAFSSRGDRASGNHGRTGIDRSGLPEVSWISGDQIRSRSFGHPCSNNHIERNDRADVWGRGKLRLYPLLIGMAAGYASAYFFGVLELARLREMFAVALFSMPSRAQSGWAFDFAVLPPFLIASLASTLKAVGDLSFCQKNHRR